MNKPFLFVPSSLALALMAVMQPAFADDYVLPTITVAANKTVKDSYAAKSDSSTLRTNQKNLDVPQTINVVSNRYIQDFKPANLDDALTQVSGITQGNTLGGTQDTVMKRGFGDNRDGSIMVNGMPTVQGRVMNENVDTVNVLKGPSSLLYGIMDPGGVVNAITKQPQKEQSTSVSLYGSTYQQGRNGAGASVDTTGQIETSNFSYRLVVDHSDSNYWRNFGQNQQTLIAPSLKWDNSSTQVNFSYQYHKFNVPFDRTTVFDTSTGKALPISKYTRLDEKSNQMWGDDHLAQLTIDHQINDNWKAHAGYSYNYESYDANQLRITKVDTSTHTVTRRADGTRGAQSIDSFGQFYLDGRETIFGLQHDLQFGTDIEYRKYYRKDLIRGTTSTLDYLNPTYGNGASSMSGTVSASDSDQTDKLHTYGVYFQDSIHLTSKWIGVIGARYTHWDQLAGKGRPFKINTNTDDGKWLPRAGLVYKWNDDLSFYGSYTQSLKPSSSIAALGGGTVTSDVQPEESQSYELGMKYELSDRFSTNLAVYNIKKKNVLESVVNSSTGDTELHTAGRVRSKGVELDVTGRITNKLDTILTYAYTDAKVTEDDDTTLVGKNLQNVAKNTGSLSLAYNYGDFYQGKLRFGMGANYVGNRAGDAKNTFKLPDYTVVNAFVSYDTKIENKDVNLQLNINNLLDQTYYTSSVTNLTVSQGASRQAVLRATVKF
nr:TonB-dependent siderophore receptor [Acinetobacter soli]